MQVHLTPAKIVGRALEILSEQQPVENRKTASEAVAHIRAARRGITLGGLKIKDLIHEGHK